MNRVGIFTVAAAAETLTGLAVLAFPGTISRLLLGAELGAAGEALARFGGIAFVFLGIACWSGASWRALWLFQPAAAVCLVYVALGSGLHGVLIWPAVVYHTGATILLGLCLRKGGEESRSESR